MYFLDGNRCGNVNWARRQTCNMCNAPKFGDLEERTGYGGGFNEREGVEYIQREESDDEYDEFGRKKKKFRNKTQSTSSDKKVCLNYDLDETVRAYDWQNILYTTLLSFSPILSLFLPLHCFNLGFRVVEMMMRMRTMKTTEIFQNTTYGMMMRMTIGMIRKTIG